MLQKIIRQKIYRLRNNYQIDGMLERIQRLWNKEKEKNMNEVNYFEIIAYFPDATWTWTTQQLSTVKRKYNCNRLLRSWLWSVRKETKRDNRRVNWMKQFSSFNKLNSSRRPVKLTIFSHYSTKNCCFHYLVMSFNLLSDSRQKVSVFLISLDPRTITQRTNQSRIRV